MKSLLGISGLVLFVLVACGAAMILHSHKSKKAELQLLEAATLGANNGNAKDQYSLGLMYSTGQGVPQDYSKAFLWYHKAADQGNPGGENGLGFLYSNGRDASLNYAEALRWCQKAAEQENSKA